MMRSNQTDQMARRLQQFLAKQAPELTSTIGIAADGVSPLLTIKASGSTVALCRLNRRSFVGYNIVGELSSDMAQGFPEHECWLSIISAMAADRVSKLAIITAKVGCADFYLSQSATPAESDMATSSGNFLLNLSNSAELGSVGV